MLERDPAEFQGFFLEASRPVWESRVRPDPEEDPVRYGTFDHSRFNELELRMYILIKARLASMYELQNVYTLDEALKLYALYRMELDIEIGRADDLKREGRGRY